ncbi:MAG TPA: hypothetical protein VKY74_12460 [Chloroflexia bacterium]|nr:hypothetical protein [Chloroflexia bacterium]
MIKARITGPLLLLVGVALLVVGCGQVAGLATPTPGQPVSSQPTDTPPPATAAPASSQPTDTPPPATAAPEDHVNPPIGRNLTGSPTPAPSTTSPPMISGPIVGTSIAPTGSTLGPPLRDITPLPPGGTPLVLTPDATGTVVLTLAGEHQWTVEMKTGNTLQLALGNSYDWTVTVANPAVLGLAGPSPDPGQGRYTALQPGQTLLTILADPHCRKVTPPCGMPSRIFAVTIVVH